ncbi:SDR family NAD(P)-dependent oxidoreductase [Trujillonella endophytica]|uniref:Short-chain dehydrogenase n=1 Tax=Trujillonella endophytica TaxID=673521 RepID=A0A1H8VVG9_9ACTN|nr:SDR family NAD(P)-dependent oxidoreductase [Trujillella endophytica]SEP19442.1 Short-chain dehydrogenase [Trujillella endophytica]
MEELSGRTAVVTGGAAGIGRAVGRRLAREGMTVVLADRDADALDATVAELRGEGAEVTGVPTDVSDPDANARLADAAYDAHGAVHLLHLNAGIGGTVPLLDPDPKVWQRVVGVNLLGVVYGIKAFGARMVESGEPGVIVATSSGAGAEGTSYLSGPYAATKNAVVSVMESLYGELRDRKAAVRAAVLFPPLTASSMGNPQVEAWLRGNGVPATLMQPEDVAELLLDGVRRGRFYIRIGREQSASLYNGAVSDDFFEWNERVIRSRAEAQISDGTPEGHLW